MTAATASGLHRGAVPQVMACSPAGGAVVSALDLEGAPRGLTTSAEAGVSLGPTLLLDRVDRLDRISRTLPAIEDAGRFAVDSLDVGRARAPWQVACAAEGDFAGLVWSSGVEGAAVVGARRVARAVCRAEGEREAGGQHAIIGEVVRGFADERRSRVCRRRRVSRRTELEG